MEPRPDASDELVEVVDDDDQVIAVVTRAEMRAGRLMHRAVFVAVIDADDRVLAHRRSDSKDLWPGWWDVAVGGVVALGESYDQAARRELHEEVGLVGEPQLVGDGRYVDDAVALLGRCYLLRYRPALHGTPAPLDGEVAELVWVARDELARWVSERPVLPDSLQLLGSLLFPAR